MRAPAAATVLLASLAAAAAPFEYLPPQPQAGEPFVATAVMGYGVRGACPLLTMSASVSGERIDVTEDQGPGYRGSSRACRLGAVVPGLAPGRYLADFRLSTGTIGTGPVVTVVPGTPAQPARRDVTGNWFDPAESGWGLNIVQGESGKLFIAWMTYRPQGRSHWLVVSDGRWITPTTWRGIAHQTRNVPFDAAAAASQLQVTPVGYVEVAFTGPDEAAFVGRFMDETGLEPMIGKQATLRRMAF